MTTGRARLRVLAAAALVATTAGCGSARDASAGSGRPAVPTSASPTAPDPADLATRARTVLETADGFSVTGTMPFEAETATVNLAVGRRTGHGTLISPSGTVVVDWDADLGLFLTASTSFWATYGQPDLPGGQPVSVPATVPLGTYTEYVSIDEFVPELFEMLAGSPTEATPTTSSAGDVLEVPYDVGGSQLTVLVADGSPVRVVSTGADLTIGDLGRVPSPRIPAAGQAVPYPS